MGYIIAIVLILVAVPLLLLVLSRRPSGAGTLDPRRRSGGFTPTHPSADAPTPQPDSINQRPEAERRLPPS
jgi:hypothetical protein